MRGRFNGRVVGQDYTGRNSRHNGRAGIYNAVQSAFAPSLDITLANGLGPLFTYTRATTATVKDFEGLIKNCLSGELRIQGARRVQNWLTNSTDSSTWSTATSGTGTATKTDNYGTAPDGTLTAARLVATKGSGFGVVRIPKTGNLPGTAIQQTCWIKSNTAGSQNVELGNAAVAYATVTVTPTWKRLTPGVQTVSAGGASSLEIGAGGSGADASIDILIWHPQMEDVTGQSNQNPSEYVSVGVLSAPYHGYFADGVKYFSYQNGNTVSSNVVTEATGTAITGTIGYLVEGARTNLTWPSVPDPTNWSIYPPSSADVSSSKFVNVDGTSTARFVKALATTGSHGTYHGNNTTSIGTSNGTIYTAWWYLKAGTLTKARPQITTASAADGVYAEFDLSNGTILTNATTLNAAVPVANSAFIELIGNGWYKCGFSYTANAGLASVTYQTVQVLNAAGSNNYTGDGTSGLYVGGDQLEAGANASSWQPTTTAGVARNADVLTFPIAGILNNTQGGAYAKCTQNWTGILSAYAGIIGDRAMYIQSSGNKLSMYDGTTENDTKTITLSSTSAQKFMTTWGGSSMRQFAGGSGGTATAFDGDLGMGATMQIGSSTFNGVIESVKCWMSKPSDASAQGITA